MSDKPLLKVMFVDDESRVLQGLQRMLRPMRDEWDMYFLESGQAALAEMAKSPFDVVVSDMRMPSMSGAELLTRVMRDFPSTVRIILSGQAEKDLVQKYHWPDPSVPEQALRCRHAEGHCRSRCETAQFTGQ